MRRISTRMSLLDTKSAALSGRVMLWISVRGRGPGAGGVLGCSSKVGTGSAAIIP